MKARRLVALAMMVALSVGLHYLEGLIPNFIPVPGFHLGLANTIALFVLYYYGAISYIFVSFTKVLIVSLISGNFVSAMMSVTGTVLAVGITLLCYFVIKSSIFGTSTIAALFHTLGQLLAYAIFFRSFYIYYYTIILGPIAIGSGLLVALLVMLLIKALPKRFKNEEEKRRSN